MPWIKVDGHDVHYTPGKGKYTEEQIVEEIRSALKQADEMEAEFSTEAPRSKQPKVDLKEYIKTLPKE